MFIFVVVTAVAAAAAADTANTWKVLMSPLNHKSKFILPVKNAKIK